MKRKNKSLIAMLFLSYACSNITYAFSSCEQDVGQMYTQIGQYESITSHDGHRFTDVYSPFENDNKCFAKGYYTAGTRHEPVLICSVKWTKGDWGDTLACV